MKINNIETKTQKPASTPEFIQKNLDNAKKYLDNDGKPGKEFAELLYKCVRPIITGVLGPQHPSEIEDAVQQVVLHVIERFRQYDGRASLTTWLIKIGYNQAIDFFRKEKARDKIFTKDPLDEIFITAEDVANPLSREDEFSLAVENADLLMHIMSRLTAKERHILELHFIEDLSIEEIVDILGLEASNVKTQIQRAKVKAREFAETNGYLTKRENYGK